MATAIQTARASGFTLKSCYRAALGRARLALSWEDRLDALTTAERLRHRILAEKGRYRLSVSDYSMAPVCASARKRHIRRVFSLDGGSFEPFSPELQSRLDALKAAWPPVDLGVAA